MKKLILLFVLITLTSGCAAEQVIIQPKHDVTVATYGLNKIVYRNKDLYLEQFDGSESRRITNTPDVIEISAGFVNKGRDIVYTTQLGMSAFSMHTYLQPADKDDNYRKEIGQKELNTLAP